MHSIDIYRNGSVFTTIKLDATKTNTQNKTLMGENILSLSFVLSYHADFQIGDYCTVFGEVYRMNEQPQVDKQSSLRFEYTVRLVAEGTDLSKVIYLFYGPTNTLTECDFSLMGTAQDFLQLLIDNANRVNPGQWTMGQVAITGYKNLTFAKENCYNALVKIAEAFDTEFLIVGRTVHLVKVAIDKGYLFKHGRNKGLYRLQRIPVAGSSVITRLYAFGAEKNLPPTYGSRRLHLPSLNDPCLVSNIRIDVAPTMLGSRHTFHLTPASGSGITGLTIMFRVSGSGAAWTEIDGPNADGRLLYLTIGVNYEFKFRTEGGACAGSETGIIQGPTTVPQNPYTPTPYLEQNTSLYGVIEYTEYFEDVYPRRTGKVTSVNAANVYQFLDTTMDFDLNSYLLPGGVSPKVTFNTGQLAGYTFDVSAYNHTTKTFTILKNKNERSIEVPSLSLKPAIGDEYVLTDIQMPQSYIVNAEKELETKAKAFLQANSAPQVSYAVEIDPVFMKRVGWSVSIGDVVRIKDADFGIDKKIRIVSVVRDLVQETKYQIQLADKVSAGKVDVLVSQGSSNASSIQQINQQFTNLAIFNNKVIGDLQIDQGTAVIKSAPQTTTTTGFLALYLEVSTGKIFVKV